MDNKETRRPQLLFQHGRRCFMALEEGSAFRRFVDTVDCIEASGIADVGQALGYDPDQKVLVVAQIQIPFRVTGQLRFAATLGSQKAEGNQLPLF